jgi:phosphopantetheine--protein transferase-like protein
MSLYEVAFLHALPHGIAVGVHIPTEKLPVPERILDALHPDEAAIAQSLDGFRKIQFVGGRIAVREALYHLGQGHGPLVRTERGAVQLPPNLAGSISHKGPLALAMVAKRDQGTLGVDLEEYLPARPQIERKVLRPEEMEAVALLPEDRRWIAILIRFSIKEAIYKALDPYLQRYIGFDEVQVTPDLEGKAVVQLHLNTTEENFQVDANYTWLRGRLLTSVRIYKRTVTPLYEKPMTR